MQRIAGCVQCCNPGRKRADTQAARVKPLFRAFSPVSGISQGLVKVAGQIMFQFFTTFYAERPHRGHFLIGFFQGQCHRLAAPLLAREVEFVEFAGQLLVLLRQRRLVLIVVFYVQPPQKTVKGIHASLMSQG